jgi:hypothetical protein
MVNIFIDNYNLKIKRKEPPFESLYLSFPVRE